MKDSDLVQTVRPFGASATLAADAARAISGVDPRAIASIANAINGMDAKVLGDVSVMREAAKALTFTPPVIPPTMMTAQLADALKGITDQNHARLAEVVKGILPTLDGLNLGTQFATRIAETLNVMKMPPAYTAQMREALAGLPSTRVSGLAPRAASVVEEAAVLAETPAAEEVVAQSLIDLDDLSLADRRDLQEEVAAAIAAFGSLVAILKDNGELALASATLGLLVILVSIYWRVTGSAEDD